MQAVPITIRSVFMIIMMKFMTGEPLFAVSSRYPCPCADEVSPSSAGTVKYVLTLKSSSESVLVVGAEPLPLVDPPLSDPSDVVPFAYVICANEIRSVAMIVVPMISFLSIFLLFISIDYTIFRVESLSRRL